MEQSSASWTASDSQCWEVINAAVEADTLTDGPAEAIRAEATLRAYVSFSTLTQRKQAEATILAAAARKRCKTEMAGILKAAYKDFIQQRQERGANSTVFSSLPEGIEEQLKCGKYTVDDAGIRYTEQISSDGSTATVRVCYHPLIPTEYYENIEDNTHRLRLAYMIGGRWRSIVADRATIATRQSITALAAFGVDVTSETARYMVQYLADVEAQNPHPRIKRSKSIGRMGWIGDAFAPYLDDVQYDGQDGYRALYGSIAPVGEYAAWVAQMREARKRDGHFRTQLAASFAAPVLGRLRGLPFLVHLWGGAGTGKTVCMMACASVWGNPDAGKLMRTLNGTGAGMEALYAFLCNMPVCLNELQSSRDRGNMDAMVYTFCEGQGKSRSQRGGGLRDAGSWCTVALTNGEWPLVTGSSGAGAINRVINLECGEALLAQPRQMADFVRQNYGHAGRDFTDRLRKIPVDELRAQYGACLAELQAAGCGTDKQQLSAAYLLLADRLATEWIFMDGRQLTAAEIAETLVSREEADNAGRSLEFVRGWITANRFRFKTDDETPDIEIWGKPMTDGSVAILPHILRRALTENGFSYEAFLADMDRKGLLVHDAKGKRQKPVAVNGTTQRCVVLAEEGRTEQMRVPLTDRLRPV